MTFDINDPPKNEKFDPTLIPRLRSKARVDLSAFGGDLCDQAADRIERLEWEGEKLREEQRSALACDEMKDLPIGHKPGPSVVCAEGDHQVCLLKECTCECHKDGQ